MEKKIITISREFGSGGRTIGRMVAEKLGIPFYDKELVDQIAVESGFAPKFVEEHGEHSPGSSLFSYAFAPQGVPGVMNGLSTADFLWNIQCCRHCLSSFQTVTVTNLTGTCIGNTGVYYNSLSIRTVFYYIHIP